MTSLAFKVSGNFPELMVLSFLYDVLLTRIYFEKAPVFRLKIPEESGCIRVNYLTSYFRSS